MGKSGGGGGEIVSSRLNWALTNRLTLRSVKISPGDRLILHTPRQQQSRQIE